MINVALFGFGRIGQMHAKNLSKYKEIKLLYVFDKSNYRSLDLIRFYVVSTETNFDFT